MQVMSTEEYIFKSHFLRIIHVKISFIEVTLLAFIFILYMLFGHHFKTREEHSQCLENILSFSLLIYSLNLLLCKGY